MRFVLGIALILFLQSLGHSQETSISIGDSKAGVLSKLQSDVANGICEFKEIPDLVRTFHRTWQLGEPPSGDIIAIKEYRFENDRLENITWITKSVDPRSFINYMFQQSANDPEIVVQGDKKWYHWTTPDAGPYLYLCVAYSDFFGQDCEFEYFTADKLLPDSSNDH